MENVTDVFLEKFEVQKTIPNLKQKFRNSSSHKTEFEFFCPNFPLLPNSQFGVAKPLPRPTLFMSLKLDLLYKNPKRQQAIACLYNLLNFTSTFGID